MSDALAGATNQQPQAGREDSSRSLWLPGALLPGQMRHVSFLPHSHEDSDSGCELFPSSASTP